MVTFDLSFGQLLLYGIHIGHNINNTFIYSAWLISAFRQSTSIINLVKSVVMLRIGFLLLSNVICFNGPVWFINLDSSVDRYIKHASISCGEFNVTSRWIHGTISNYINLFNSYRKLWHVSDYVTSPKHNYFKRLFKYWYLSRYSWPRLVFISNLHNSYAPAYEALTLKIPSLCVVDTNVWSQVATIAVPGNDESISCIIFYNDLVSNFILCKKFNLVSSWFFNVRSSSRVLSFADWLCGRYNIDVGYKFNGLFDFRPNLVVNMLRSSSLFLSLNYWSSAFKDSLDVFRGGMAAANMYRALSVFLSNRTRFISILNFYFFKKFWLRIGIFKRNFLTDRNFKLRFLANSFLYRKFYRQYYFKNKLKDKRKLNIFLISVISNLFFFSRYLKVKRLKFYSNVKFNYWNFLSSLLVSNFKFAKPLWLPFFESRYKVRPYVVLKKDNIRFDLKKSSNIKLLLKADNGYSNINFFVSNIYFGSYLPKDFWIWHKDIFAPDFTSLHVFFKNYFYSQALLKFFYKKGGFSYKERFELKSNAFFLKNGYFFFLGLSNNDFYKDNVFMFNKIDWVWY